MYLPQTVVSFFSGCGGLDLGFLGGFLYKNSYQPKLPFKILAAYDSDQQAVETYKRNIGGHIHHSDLSRSDPKEMPKADILIGGFPCQDFSICGPRLGLSCERGRLYTALTRYMELHQPKVVVAENVPHLGKIDSGNVIKQILSDFENAGYVFQRWDLFAPDYGVPQRRTRIFLVGVRNDLLGSPNKPLPTNIGQHRSVEWAIHDLECADPASVPNHDQYFKAKVASRGGGQGDEKCERNKPSYTIRANSHSRIQFHYDLPRRLTVRECARLQTFPDEFTFNYSTTINMKQIGNAVPPLLGYNVGLSISNYFKTISP